MNLRCSLCNFNGSAITLYPDEGIVRCPICSLVYYQKNEPLNPEKIYNHEYFHGAEYFDYTAAEPALRKTFAIRVQQLLKFKSDGSLFEIGSAYGYFLQMASEHWQARGIDVAREAVRYARERLGLDVMQGDFLDLEDEFESYDILCLWDTIEHLEQPISYVEKAARWLKPGGILALTTGDIGSFVASLRGRRWRLIHPPTHLFYFSKSTITRVLEKANLQIVDFSHVGTYRGIKAMLHGLFSLSIRQKTCLDRLLAIGGSRDIPIYLNLQDVMFVVAQKPE